MDLQYDILGQGPPIVMIHSPGVDSREWKHLVPLLAGSFRVITFDARGTGQSPAPQEPFSLVEDLYRLLRHLQTGDQEHALVKQGKVTLLGHSMGGQTATDFTLTYPEMVEGLILLAPSLSGYNYSPEFLDYMAHVNSLAPDIAKLVEASLDGPNYRVVMASQERDFLIEMQTSYMTRVFTEWRSFEVLWPQPPAIKRLEEITCPALFVKGDVEWADMEGVAQEFSRLPAIKYAEIAGADHMLALTHPRELAAAIIGFVNDTAAAGR